MTDTAHPDTARPAAGPAAVDALLRDPLATALGDPEAVAAAFDDPAADLFSLGLDSLRAFALLEALAAEGVDVDFLDFTETPTVAFLRSAGPAA